VLFATALALLLAAPASAAGGDVLVSNGSPNAPFSQNKQNEPAMAIDANHPTVVVAGSNDEIDEEACNAGNPTKCPFTAGIGVSGFYYSNDSGKSWTQPTYTGWTARNCLGPAVCAAAVGSIGTLPGTSRTAWSLTATRRWRSARSPIRAGHSAGPPARACTTRT